ncbi:unnamed protein product [Mytilus edulis]|uniref:G-protein coupled receptors family 1 profile domain-containing protein n=1 Tax=Mytilus edulis TaxID=6550 RepID=A0A8S3UFQ8_MYTED|nr:unnamed protein product [Mytilus edulis]
MSHHLSLSSFTFHSVSYLITTCLGIQKVIAIRFPIWTRNQLTNKKAVICSVVCFLLPITISIPRHFSIWSKWSMRGYVPDKCDFYFVGEGILQYSTVYYLMIQTVLVTCCCLIMLMSTVYILYKLLTNKFRGRMTEQRRQERRSVVMVIIVLVVFLITEVPKVILHVWWCYTYIAGHFKNTEVYSVNLITNYDQTMSWLLVLHTNDIFIGNAANRLFSFLILMTSITLFTIVGCLSNFLIYIVMSTKMRNEIVLFFKKMCNFCTHKREMKSINKTANIYSKQIESMINDTGNKCTDEIEMNQVLGIRTFCTDDIGRNHEEGNRNGRTHSKEINRLLGTGNHYKDEIEIDPMEETADHGSIEIEMHKLEPY